MRTSLRSTPNWGVIFEAFSKMIAASLSRPASILEMASDASRTAASSEISKARLDDRTISIKSNLAMVFRVSPSTISSSRDRAFRSLSTRWKKTSGSAIRHRQYVSTQMYFLSLVGIWLGSPFQEIQRFSK